MRYFLRVISLFLVCATFPALASEKEDVGQEARVDPEAVRYLAKDNLYPHPAEGQTRCAFIPPIREDEDNCQIEIIAGKHMQADSANRQFIMGQFKEVTIQGWGFTYYKLSTNDDHVMSTLVGGGRPVDKFVEVRDRVMARYNSRLPIVVIAPAGYEIRFRIWKAPAQFETMPTHLPGGATP